MRRFPPLAILLLLVGCSGNSATDARPDTASEPSSAPFSGCWQANSDQGTRLYIGQRRWCLASLEPNRIVIGGDIQTRESKSDVQPITLTATNTWSQSPSHTQLLKLYNGSAFILSGNSETLHLTAGKDIGLSIVGDYTYKGDMAPSKGYSGTNDWGATPYPKSPHRFY